MTNTPGDADSVYRIVSPGSYYLTGTLFGVVGKHGIEIASSGVTLDLNGFELRGITGTLSGVYASVSNLENIEVRNGSIRYWGSWGIDLATRFAFNCSVSGIRARGNGQDGVFAGKHTTISDCVAYANGVMGIRTSTGCTVTACKRCGEWDQRRLG